MDMEITDKDKLPNLPEGFLSRMHKLLGGDYPLFAESYRQPRVQGLRLNGLKGDTAQMEKDCRAYFHLTPVLWAKNGFYYAPADRPGKHPYHEAGLYYIQEPSAMAVVEALNPQPGERVLDLCAAPGGKSTQIAACLRGEGLLVSNEIHPARAKILSQNMERMGAANGIVTNHDAQTLAEWLPEFFDKIVVDAPCSGEGMFRKDPEARTEWTPDSPRQCSLRQREILRYAAQMLKPGGRMVYSTCTFSPEENEETIEAFLQEHPDISIESADVFSDFRKTPTDKEGFPRFGKGRPDWTSNHGRGELESTFRLWPHQLPGEGHYLAILRKAPAGSKTAAADQTLSDFDVPTPTPKKRRKEERKTRQKSSGINDRELQAIFLQFCRETFIEEDGKKQGEYLLFGDQLYCVPEGLPDMTGKKILRPGLHLGTFKKNRFEPSHALALSLHKEQVKHHLPLTSHDQQVIRYLNGESIPAESAASGWVLVTVDGYSLGWGKLAGGRLQNHYPKGLRWV